MAKQAGDYFIEGTIDDLTFYKMCGDYYVRMKTSLTGKRFWKDKAFEGSRKSCCRFGEGNTLASAVFKRVEKEKKTNRLFPFLRKRAIALLKEGRRAEEVECLLVDYLIDFGFIEVERKHGADGVAKQPEVVRKGDRLPYFQFCLSCHEDKHFIHCLADPSCAGIDTKVEQMPIA